MATILETINQVLTYENEPERQRELLKNTFELTEEQVAAIMQAIESIPEDYTQLVSVVEGLVASYGALETTVDGLSADVDDLKADLTDMDGKIAASLITNTASGSIASFPDGADNVPVEDLTVQITPVQDLHGYDAPWPSGGGVNKCPSPLQTTTTESGLTFTCDGKGECSLSGTASSGVVFNLPIDEVVLPSTVYVHLFNSNYFSSNTPVIDFMNDSTTVDFVGINITQNRIYNGTSDMGGKTINGIRIRVPSGFTGSVTFKLYISDSDAIVDFAPYSNICPISGWTGATVVRTGKNLIKLSDEALFSSQRVSCEYTDTGAVFTASGDYARAGYQFEVISGQTYTVSFKGSSTEGHRSVYAVMSSDWASYKTFTLTSTETYYSWTFTASDSVYRIGFYVTSSTTTGNMTIKDLQLELGSTVTPYEPYQGNTYSVDWTTEAGTVYGGTLDVTTGVLTVDRAMVDLGTLTWSGNQRFTATVSDVLKAFGDTTIPNWICSSLKIAIPNDIYANIVDYAVSYYTDHVIQARVNSITDATSFKAAMSGVQLCYELATHITIQLTARQMTTLLGQNNIWADCGDVSVDYSANTKLYIEKLTAPTEDDMTANNTIPDATYFMIGNTLYLSTTTIPAGDTINPGTNCTRMTLASALNALNA